MNPTSEVIVAMSPLLLLVLACPIGMGLMMWFMGRGMRGGHGQTNGAPNDGRSAAAPASAQARPAESVEQAR